MRTLHLFEGYGIELEYMIVDADTLAVRPITDQVLHQVTGNWIGDFENGPIGWSNELVLHVIEVKTNGPSPSLQGLDEDFGRDLARIQGLLDPMRARLLPTAMHPFMDPHLETVLWPHDHNAVYERFDSIFDCKGHGWSNLQSMHVNLPFADDDEFGRLHAALRFLIPLMPALAASSPFVEGRPSGFLDTRMEFYRNNARRLPIVSGHIVPEPASDRAEYQTNILERIYADLAPHDPDNVLRYEWVNARGCIARFDRNAIEVRVIDVQETPRADLAIAALVAATARRLTDGGTALRDALNGFDTDRLAGIFRSTLVDAERTVVDDAEYLAALGVDTDAPMQAGDVWSALLDRSGLRDDEPEFARTLDFVHAQGTLARRMLRAAGLAPDRARILRIYRRCSDCLLTGELFDDRDVDA